MHKCTFAGFDCTVEREQYVNGGIALELIDAEDGMPVARATVNMPDLADQLGAGEVFIKNYSENTGMLDALVKHKIVEDTGRRVKDGFVVFPIAKVLI